MPPIDWMGALEPLAAPRRERLSEFSDVLAYHVDVSLAAWELPSGEACPDRKATYGWKPQVQSRTARLQRSVGEIEITERLRKVGLSAFWIDNFGSAPSEWRAWSRKPSELPRTLQELDGRIRKHPLLANVRAGGWPDVVAWRTLYATLFFIEYKGPSAADPARFDKIGSKQDAWYRAALDLREIREEQYCVARWTPDQAARAGLATQLGWRTAKSTRDVP